MKFKVYLCLFLFVLMLTLGSFERVWACSCGRPSLCQAYNFADYVFVGKLIDDKNGVLTFSVEEGFIGKKGDKLKTLSGTGGSCFINFIKNRSYLIFGHQTSAKFRRNEFWKNSFWTTVCHRNSEITRASEDLTFLRNLPTESVGGRISGKVYNTEWNEYRELIEKPIANVSVRIQETKRNLMNKFLRTNEKGEFEATVPAGIYQIKIDVPSGFKLYESPYNPFEVRNAGCADQPFELEEINKK